MLCEIFESLRGLNVHRRSCFITDQTSLKDLFTPSDFIPSVIPYDIPNDFEHLLKVNLLPGVKLPYTENDWNIANDYFKLHLHHNFEITDINLTMRTFNQTVFNYFHNCCGPGNPIDNDLELKKKH